MQVRPWQCALTIRNSQNLLLNSSHPSDKVCPSITLIPAINRVVCQMCVSVMLHQNQLQIRSEAGGVPNPTKTWMTVTNKTSVESKLFIANNLWTASTSDIDIDRLLSYLTHVFKSNLWLCTLTYVWVCHRETAYVLTPWQMLRCVCVHSGRKRIGCLVWINSEILLTYKIPHPECLRGDHLVHQNLLDHRPYRFSHKHSVQPVVPEVHRWTKGAAHQKHAACKGKWKWEKKMFPCLWVGHTKLNILHNSSSICHYSLLRNRGDIMFWIFLFIIYFILRNGDSICLPTINRLSAL